MNNFDVELAKLELEKTDEEYTFENILLTIKQLRKTLNLALCEIKRLQVYEKSHQESYKHACKMAGQLLNLTIENKIEEKREVKNVST